MFWFDAGITQGDGGFIALLIIQRNAVKEGCALQIDAVEDFIQRCRFRRQAQLPLVIALIAEIEFEILAQNLFVGLDLSAQQMIELEHLRIAVGSDHLRRLTAHALHHTLIIENQGHDKRRGLMPPQTLLLSD